jgi:hypothetical protein
MNSYLSMLHTAGVNVDAVGDSTEPLAIFWLDGLVARRPALRRPPTGYCAI